ncbi:hypothetical protein Tco_0511450 [Tanacetum coccineum]
MDNHSWIVKKLKRLKRHLKNLNWSYGNAYEKVSNLKEKLKIAHAKVDANPHDSIVKAEEAKILLEYKESMSDEKVEPITDIDELFSTKLTKEDNDMMFKEVTDVEIKEALFDIRDNKSLGPDRYMGLNAILITLVPKVSNASKVTEYRPIACCNDNILLSQELLKGYDRKVGPKRWALKIDIAKAYDTLVDKARCKVQDLKNKVLSYVGRLQLVASTLAAMQLYWACVFLLPKTTVRDIDRVLKDFLYTLKKKAKMLLMPDDWDGIVNAMKKNKRIFANENRKFELLLELIFEKIRLKLMSLKVKASSQVSNVAKEWNVTMDILRSKTA